MRAPNCLCALSISQEECSKFGRLVGIQSTCCYGGEPKRIQLQALRRGVHLIIATPGRLNDFLEGRQVHLSTVIQQSYDAFSHWPPSTF